jgi:polysaccharide pyruvyl transferase WcaK-like protein
MRMIETPRQPTVAAFGEWCQTNIGDHAIHEGVQEFFGDCGWRVRSFDIGSLRPADGPRPAAAAPQGGGASRRSPVLAAMPTAKRALRGWRQQLLIRRLLAPLADCNAICVGGGALLTDSNLHFPQSLAALSWAARKLDIPLFCLGCSAEGDWSARGRGIVRQFLGRCRFIALRDHASAGRVSDLLGREVPVFGDFALRLHTAPAADASPPARQYLVAVNAAHIPAPYNTSRRQYERNMVQVVARAMARAPRQPNTLARLAVFTTGTAHDLEPAARLCAQLAWLGAELHPGRSLDQLRRLLRASGSVIAARLHAAIIPLADRVPVIGYSATPKVGNFFDSVGLDDCHFSLGDAPDSIVSAVLRVMQHGQALPRSAISGMNRTRDAAREFLDTLAASTRRREVAGS